MKLSKRTKRLRAVGRAKRKEGKGQGRVGGCLAYTTYSKLVKLVNKIFT